MKRLSVANAASSRSPKEVLNRIHEVAAFLGIECQSNAQSGMSDSQGDLAG